MKKAQSARKGQSKKPNPFSALCEAAVQRLDQYIASGQASKSTKTRRPKDAFGAR